MEIKALSAKPEEINDRIVTGFAAVFGNVDSGRDRLHRGAFKKTLEENGRRIRHLWQHDMNQPPIAKILDLREVGKNELPEWTLAAFPEATGGLMVKREYLDTIRAEEVLQGIRAGVINEMSFGYDAVKFDYSNVSDGQVRNLKEVRLYDTSDVVFGMNPATSASKAQGETILSDLFTQLSSADDKAAPAAMLLQALAGHVLSNPVFDWTQTVDTVKALLDQLTAEPPQAEDLAALTEEIKARLMLHKAHFDLMR